MSCSTCTTGLATDADEPCFFDIQGETAALSRQTEGQYLLGHCVFSKEKTRQKNMQQNAQRV